MVQTAESDVCVLVAKGVRFGMCTEMERMGLLHEGRDRHGPTLGSFNLREEQCCLEKP